MTEHDFQVKEEKLKSQIREEKIKQLTFNIDAEKEKTKQANHVLNTEKQKTLETVEDTNIARLKVEGKRKDTVLLKHGISRKNIDANHQNRENQLYKKTLELKYEDLETGYDAAKQLLQNRREVLKQQGVLKVDSRVGS